MMMAAAWPSLAFLPHADGDAADPAPQGEAQQERQQQHQRRDQPVLQPGAADLAWLERRVLEQLDAALAAQQGAEVVLARPQHAQPVARQRPDRHVRPHLPGRGVKSPVTAGSHAEQARPASVHGAQVRQRHGPILPQPTGPGQLPVRSIGRWSMPSST